MTAPGATDLEAMLASLDVQRRPGVFTFVAVEVPTPGLLAAAHGMVKEGTSTTLVLPIESARRAGLPVVVEMAWLSLTVQSSLEAVGLTAAFSKVLGDAGIPCNVHTDVQALRKQGDGLKKETIVKIGDPALLELRKLTRLESDEILSSSEALAKARADLLELAVQRAACIDALLLIDLEAFGKEELEAEEKEIAATALSIDRDARKVLEQNKKLAEEIEPSEAAGVVDLNELRILIGLQPCLIDPKLCAAARGHSEDMEKERFFAHESPVPGKKTPWDRAKKAGTKANSENIFVGSTSGKAANRGWWHSPGHHVNMLAPNVRFVGMGVHGKHWTQMFRG